MRDSGPGTSTGAYAARAAEYASALGTMEATAAPDRELIRGWVLACDGQVVDAGCGPGHWTAYLREAGVEASGIDPVREFVELARVAHPGVEYRVGSFDGLAPNAFDGVLAWYSLIHLAPADLPAALEAIRRSLRPGGSLLAGFFAGEVLEPFDHAVVTAWFWPMALMAERLREAGFAVEHQEQRHDEGSRPHAAIIARRVD